MNNHIFEITYLQCQVAENEEQIKLLFDQNGLAVLNIDTHDDMGHVVIEFDSM